MIPHRWRVSESDPVAPADRVTPVEAFFDIVFVFTFTQLTRSVAADLSLRGVGRALPVFCVLWYLYSGYVWLTNHVPPRRASQKLLLFAGMTGFFLAAIAIPQVFEGTGVLFGLGFLVVVAVHLLLFTQSDALSAVLRLAPFNVGGALLVLAAGFARGAASYTLWIAGYLVMAVFPYLVPRLSWVGSAQVFHVAASHFVERHGLLVMIALGESVIAVGTGVHLEHASAGAVGLIVAALALPGALWWAYFTDYGAAEHALAAAEAGVRSRLATRVYYFAHIPMLLGIVIAAAGIHEAIAAPRQPSSWAAATALAGGVALFLLGIADLRRCFALAPPLSRIVAALALLASAPLGAGVGAGLHLTAVLAIVAAMLWLTRPRPALPASPKLPPASAAPAPSAPGRR